MADGLLWPQLNGQFPPDQVPWLSEPETGVSFRRLALLVAYDGRDFSGWQIQPGKLTIQETLEKALSQLNNQPVRLEASGRTDAGVHAWGQVAAFKVSSDLPLTRMMSGLRSGLLPASIYVRCLGIVPEGFHPRFQAQAKTYDYYLRCGRFLGPFMNHYMWHLPFTLDLEAMRQCLRQLHGVWDFKLLSGPRCQVQGSTSRTILSAELAAEEASGLIRVRITASGFLRHVVRNLIGLLVQVGLGRIKTEDLLHMLQSPQRNLSAPKAPPGGLYLHSVWYQPYTKDIAV